MKKKGNAARRPYSGESLITCQVCGNDQFERSMKEESAIVRLASTKGGTAVKEEIVREGSVEFTYRCAKCGIALLDSSPKQGK